MGRLALCAGGRNYGGSAAIRVTARFPCSQDYLRPKLLWLRVPSF